MQLKIQSGIGAYEIVRFRIREREREREERGRKGAQDAIYLPCQAPVSFKTRGGAVWVRRDAPGIRAPQPDARMEFFSSSSPHPLRFLFGPAEMKGDSFSILT